MASESKSFCPVCRRTNKGGDICSFCKVKMIGIGKKWRLPKHDASKAVWKKELSKLVWYTYDENLEKLYNEHNLPYIMQLLNDEEKNKIPKGKKIYHLLYTESKDKKRSFNQINSEYRFDKYICVVKNKDILKTFLLNDNYILTTNNQKKRKSLKDLINLF